MSYIGNEPIVSATRTVTEVTATAGQTVFTANGGYTVGFLDVFINGSKLTSADFTATNGTTVTLTEAAQVSDIVRLEALGTFLASNGVAKTGDTMTGDLSIERGSGLAARVNIRGNGNSSSTDLMLMQGSDSVAYLYQKANAALVLGTNNTDRMRIDSSGRVTTPSQPAFYAYKTGNMSLNSTDTKVVYDATATNIGSFYNTSTGRFTAPVSGLYQFNVITTIISSGSSNYMAVYPYVNGVSFGTARIREIVNSAGSSSYGGANGSLSIYLNANDYIELYAYSQASTITINAGEASWSGYLVG